MCEWGYLIHNTDSTSNVGKDGLSVRGGQNTEQWGSDCFITVPAINGLLCSYKCTLGCLMGKSGHGPSNHAAVASWHTAQLCQERALEIQHNGQAPGAHRHSHYVTHMALSSAKCLRGAASSSICPPHVFPNSWLRPQQHSGQPQKEKDHSHGSHTFSSVPHIAKDPVGLAV